LKLLDNVEFKLVAYQPILRTEIAFTEWHHLKNYILEFIQKIGN